jgi:FKBP-type peptidyl-prolyl cis-trans isomerase SlyD
MLKEPLTITKNKVVSFDYTLKNIHNEVIDTSESGPLVYLHGYGNLIPGLEKAIEGKAEADSFKITVPAAEAYGDRTDDMITTISRSNFPDVPNLTEGMEFAAQFPDGNQIVKVIKVTDKEVTVDGNHPLAGMDLSFEITIREIRDATEEEIAHGDIHHHQDCDCGADDSCGCGGCHH